MIYKGYDVKVSKHKIIWEIDNKRYNLKKGEYDKLLIDRVYGIFTELQSMNDTELKDYIDESLIEEQIKTDKPLIKGKNKEKEYEVMLPTGANTIENKKYPYNSYNLLNANSKFNPKKKDGNYIYKKDITKILEEAKKEFPNGKIPTPRQMEKHIKIMLECDIPLLKVENTPAGIVYRLDPRADGTFVKMPRQQLNELVVSTNKNMLKLFTVLKYTCDFENYKPVDRKYLARKIGLSDKATNTLDNISTMLASLVKLGFIDIKTVRDEYVEDGKIKYRTVNSYRLRTLEEYKEITNRARGKK